MSPMVLRRCARQMRDWAAYFETVADAVEKLAPPPTESAKASEHENEPFTGHLSKRDENVLAISFPNVLTWGELACVDISELMKMNNFATTSRNLLRDALIERGFTPIETVGY